MSFRDLFVELPLAVFDALKAIGEQAILDAQSRRVKQRTTKTAFDALNSNVITSSLCERYLWRQLATERSPFDRVTLFGGRNACGHWSTYELSDNVIEGASAETLLRVIDNQVASGRDCYCMQREVFR